MARQLSVVKLRLEGVFSGLFVFLTMFAYRGKYVFTTPGLFTLYAIADEGIHYRASLVMVKSLDGF